MGIKKDLDGVWRTEGEIKDRNYQQTKLGCILVAITTPLVAIHWILEEVGLIGSEEEKVPVIEETVAPTRESGPDTDQLISSTENEASEHTQGPRPPLPPTDEIARISHLINASPDEGVAALLQLYSGSWQTVEPISFGGAFGQTEQAGLMWRMSLPEKPAKPASTQYTVQGANEWSRWEPVELDIATVKFERSEHFYPSIRLSPVLDVAFTGEDEIVFAMVVTPGQEPIMVPMQRAALPETELPNLFSKAEEEVGEILSVFKEGTLDEAKVIVSRLEATATNFPDAVIVPSLRDHILAVFRAEHAFFSAQNKALSAKKRIAGLPEEDKAAARQNNSDDALGSPQETLRLAKQEEQQLKKDVEGSRQAFNEALVRAGNFCEEGGSFLNNFATILSKVRERVEK